MRPKSERKLVAFGFVERNHVGAELVGEAAQQGLSVMDAPWKKATAPALRRSGLLGGDGLVEVVVDREEGVDLGHLEQLAGCGRTG